MVRKVTLILAALAVVLLLVKFVDSDLLYQATYVGVAGTGLVLSVFYLVTWGYSAIRAWRHGLLSLGSVTVAEFIVIPILAVPSFGSALYNVWMMGFTVNPTPGIRFSRLLGLSVLLLVMILRTANWVSRWRSSSGEAVVAEKAGSESRPV